MEAVPDIFNLLPINEAPKSHVEEDAEFQELVYSHLPLPVENVPEALPAHADAARKFGHSYTAHTPRIFYSLDD